MLFLKICLVITMLVWYFSTGTFRTKTFYHNLVCFDLFDDAFSAYKKKKFYVHKNADAGEMFYSMYQGIATKFRF